MNASLDVQNRYVEAVNAYRQIDGAIQNVDLASDFPNIVHLFLFFPNNSWSLRRSRREMPFDSTRCVRNGTSEPPVSLLAHVDRSSTNSKTTCLRIE
jgi:hypothetical protein